MNRYLLFRTDRIGDFLLSAILIKSIKRNDPYSYVIVVGSEKNYTYMKTLKLIDEVILYPSNIIEKFFFFKNVFSKKFKSKIALDGKKRSIGACIFGKAKYKFLLTTKIFYKKIFKKIFSKIIHKDDCATKILEIESILSTMGYDLKLTDYDIFEHEKNFQIKKTSGGILLHFDEKWIFNDYIKKYNTIEPSYDEFYKFICEIIEKSNKNLHISTGVKDNKILEKLRSVMFLNKDFYWKEYKSHKIFLYFNSSFIDLKKLIHNNSKIICCHGAPTHIASALNKEIIDIYDKSEELFYKKWNSHFRNYNSLYRTNFKELSKNIINLL